MLKNAMNPQGYAQDPRWCVVAQGWVQAWLVRKKGFSKGVALIA